MIEDLSVLTGRQTITTSRTYQERQGLAANHRQPPVPQRKKRTRTEAQKRRQLNLLTSQSSGRTSTSDFYVCYLASRTLPRLQFPSSAPDGVGSRQ